MLYNLPCVVAAGGNTGFGNCNFNLKNAKGIILLPAGTKIPQTKLATFVTELQALLVADNITRRAQMVKNFRGAEAANIDVTTATWGDGTEVDVQDERIGRTYQMESLCASKGLSKLNGKHAQYEALMVFDGNIGVGAPTTTETGEAAVKGFELSRIRASQYAEAMNDTQAQFTFTVVHANPEEWRTLIAFKPEDGLLISSETEPMADVNLTYFPSTPLVPGTYAVEATTACGQVNVASLYPTEIIDNTLWAASNQDGTDIPITGVIVDTSGKIVFSLTTTAPGFTAATLITIKGTAPSIWATEGLEKMEAGSVKIKK